MKDLTPWKHALKIHTPALEVVLANGLHQAVSVQMIKADTGTNEEVQKQIGQARTIIRFEEQQFHSEVFVGFGEAWEPLLADAQAFAGEEPEKELTGQLHHIIAGAMAEVGVRVEFSRMELLTGEKLEDAINSQPYFIAQLQATAEEQNEALDLWVAVSRPDEKRLAEYAEKLGENNPLLNDEYTKTAVRFAQQQYEGAGHDGDNNINSGVSMKGQHVEFEDFGKQDKAKNSREVRNIDILRDVEMHLSVELGRRQMPLGDILQLVKGSVIELEKLAGEPVEVLVNGHKIAQGEVVVIDEHFGVRISNLLASQERIKELQ